MKRMGRMCFGECPGLLRIRLPFGPVENGVASSCADLKEIELWPTVPGLFFVTVPDSLKKAKMIFPNDESAYSFYKNADIKKYAQRVGMKNKEIIKDWIEQKKTFLKEYKKKR